MEATSPHSSAGFNSPCVVCREAIISHFGSRTLVSTNCHQPHRVHWQCMTNYRNDDLPSRRCSICPQQDLPVEGSETLSVEGSETLSVYACQAGELEALQTALALDPAIVTHDFQGDTLLTIAAEHGHNLLLKELISCGADVNKARESDGVTPLYIAAQNGHHECVNTLLDEGAGIDAILIPDLDRDTVIDIVCSKAGRLLSDNLKKLSAMSSNLDILDEWEIPSDPAVLNAISSHTFIQHVTHQDSARNFTSAVIHETMRVINGEQAKLKSLDMVLAVVGTLKAGKSTTINAIVGEEILPKRNRAMTAIPTLIRHTLAQSDPILNFSHINPFNSQLRILRAKLHNVESANYPKEPELLRLLDKVRDGYQVSATCTGSENVREYLYNLNNLVSLFAAFALDFPLEEYSDLANMPVIDVRFANLCDLPKSKGQLTLLDTPGINEAGQSHNRTMVRNILRSSSAILAVVDYTQLSSESSAELGEVLQHVVRTTDHNISVWMNKFDQCDAGCDDQEVSKTVVVDQLFKGNLKTDQVFPVSSQTALLAHRALRQLAQGNAMPTTAPWVKDFGLRAFGVDWEESITDRNKVQEKAEKIWDRSLYRQPLANAIQATQAQAHILAFQSVAAELSKSTTMMKAILSACYHAAEVREQAVARQIDAINTHIDQLSQDAEQARGSIAQLEGEIRAQTEENFRRARIKIDRRLDTFVEQIIAEQEQSGKEAVIEPFHRGKSMGASTGRLAGIMAGACALGITINSWYRGDADIAPSLGIVLGALVAAPAGSITGQIVGGSIGGGVSLCRAASLYSRKVVSLGLNTCSQLPEKITVDFPSHPEAETFNSRVAEVIAENRNDTMTAFIDSLEALTEQLTLETDAIKSRTHRLIEDINRSDTSVDPELATMSPAPGENQLTPPLISLDDLFELHMPLDGDHYSCVSGIYQVQPDELRATVTAGIDSCWQELTAYITDSLDKRITGLNQPVSSIRQKTSQRLRYRLRHLKNERAYQQVLLGKLADSKNNLGNNTIQSLQRAIEWLRHQQLPAAER